MKQKFIVNENQLKQIVKESVQKVLNELDWKTYMNAARKRREQGKLDNASELEKYSNDQFNKQHIGDNAYYQSYKPYGNQHVSGYIRGNVGMNGGYTEDLRRYQTPEYEDDYISSDKGPIPHKAIVGMRNLENADVYDGFGKELTKNDSGYKRVMKNASYDKKDSMLDNVTDDYKNKRSSMLKDLDGYYNGKSKYVKGKGWVNESADGKSKKRIRISEDDEGCRSIPPLEHRYIRPRKYQEYSLNVYMKEIDNFKGYYDCWEIYYMPLDELHHLITINSWGHGIVDDDLIERVWEHVKEKREELHKLYPDNLPRPKEKKEKRKKYYGHGNDGPFPDNGNGGPFTPVFDPDMGWH